MIRPASVGAKDSVLTLYENLAGGVSNKICVTQVMLWLNHHPANPEVFDIAQIERAADPLHANSRNLFRAQLSLIKSRLQKFLVDSAIPIVQTAVRVWNCDSSERFHAKVSVNRRFCSDKPLNADRQ
jgi:hypothetical protein